ncbi:MAG: acyltransferase [Bacteroidales bacterium]|nr:acyltransferase [Bacteroidales bacterium]MCM1416468.1 acyltransferase [bacterium]MCM1424524.1 acyltransferase [bacterium]
METKRKRQANFELLRIVAMFMIISLHYLVKGWAAVPFPFAAKEHPAGVFAWLIEAFCIVAVNCYVLISGYFCVESAWKPGRIVSLLCQVLFYSLLIPVVLLLGGVVAPKDLDVYNWIGFVFPFGTEHYWFATAYLVLYLFAPFLSAGIQKMKKRDLQILLALLLAFFSLEKTILPVYLATDRYGYDFGWFLCLFVLAGYIRLYGIPWLEKRSRAAGAYALSCLLIWLLAMASNALGAKIDAFVHYANMLYSYNHLLCLAGAVALFYLVKGLSIREGRAAELIRRLAPATFGVYLLHEHILVRYEWMNWLGADRVKESFLFVPHMIVCVLLVYAVGTAVDLVRAWLFARAAALKKGA